MYEFAMVIYISYKHGKRYAYEKEYTTGYEDVLELVKKINSKYGDVGLSVYTGSSESEAPYDIMKTDLYFKDLVFVQNKDELVHLIGDSETVEPMDIAKLIANRVNCTPLALQKLLYITYCEYLKKFDEPLFAEEFKAWQYGPVVNSVYQKFKQTRDNVIIEVPKTGELRYSATKKGRSIIRTVEKVIEDFGHLSATDLVDYTHEHGRAWSITKKNHLAVITVECIKTSKDFMD